MNQRRQESAARRRRSAEFQLATTSDVAFLLLIFFISTAIFVSPYGLPILLPPAGAQPVSVEPEDVVTVSLDATGTIRAAGESRTPEELVGWARVTQAEHPGIVFRLAIHAECPYAGVVSAVDALRRANADRIHFGVESPS